MARDGVVSSCWLLSGRGGVGRVLDRNEPTLPGTRPVPPFQVHPLSPESPPRPDCGVRRRLGRHRVRLCEPAVHSVGAGVLSRLLRAVREGGDCAGQEHPARDKPGHGAAGGGGGQASDVASHARLAGQGGVDSVCRRCDRGPGERAGLESVYPGSAVHQADGVEAGRVHRGDDPRSRHAGDERPHGHIHRATPRDAGREQNAGRRHRPPRAWRRPEQQVRGAMDRRAGL